MTPREAPGPSFRYRVISVVRRIPPGRVATYGDVAEWAGAPGAARAVGTIMATTPGGTAPCHRVIAAGGQLGGYGGQESLKRSLLEAEGVRVTGRRVSSFATVRWPGPASERRGPNRRAPTDGGRPPIRRRPRASGPRRRVNLVRGTCVYTRVA